MKEERISCLKYMKKGCIEDILIEFDDAENNEINLIKELEKNCKLEKIPFRKRKLLFPFQINIYINNGITKSGKIRDNQEKEESKKSNANILNEIFSKYEIDAKITHFQKEAKKPAFTLYLTIYYFNREIFGKYKALNEIAEMFGKPRKNEDNTKNIILLENIKHAYSSNSLKQKIFESQSNQIPILDITNEEKSIFSTKNELEFKEWQIKMTVEKEFDFKLTESFQETMNYLYFAIMAVIKTKYKKPLRVFDIKGISHGEKSSFSGIKNQYSLNFVDMLMSIEGMSEEKAIAIVKQYPTIKSLMNAFVLAPAEEQELLLKDIPVFYNFDMTKHKLLGPAIAKKICRIFTNKDSSKLIKDL